MWNTFGFYCSFLLFVSRAGISFAQVKPLDTLPATLQVYVGGDSPDVKILTYDTTQNKFTAQTSSDALGSNAIWLEFDKTQNFIVSASAAKFSNKDGTGGVFSASFSTDRTLKKQSSSATPDSPVSVEISPDGKLVMVASYDGASVSTYKFSEAGKLSKEQTFKFTGSGPVKERQGKAAAHQVKLDSTGNLLLVPDLGSDKVRSFALADGKLTAHPDITVKAGCGPRHLAHAPEKSSRTSTIFYLLCELSSDLFVMELTDQKASTVQVKQTLSVLPKGADATKFNAAEIAITPDGKFLYATNRQKDPAGKVKDNTFFVFSRDKSEQLKLTGTFHTGGKGPRHFSFSPDKAASLVIVSNQDSDLVCVFKRNSETGALSQVSSTTAKSPAVALFKA